MANMTTSPYYVVNILSANRAAGLNLVDVLLPIGQRITTPTKCLIPLPPGGSARIVSFAYAFLTDSLKKELFPGEANKVFLFKVGPPSESPLTVPFVWKRKYVFQGRFYDGFHFVKMHSGKKHPLACVKWMFRTLSVPDEKQDEKSDVDQRGEVVAILDLPYSPDAPDVYEKTKHYAFDVLRMINLYQEAVLNASKFPPKARRILVSLLQSWWEEDAEKGVRTDEGGYVVPMTPKLDDMDVVQRTPSTKRNKQICANPTALLPRSDMVLPRYPVPKFSAKASRQLASVVVKQSRPKNPSIKTSTSKRTRNSTRPRRESITSGNSRRTSKRQRTQKMKRRETRGRKERKERTKQTKRKKQEERKERQGDPEQTPILNIYADTPPSSPPASPSRSSSRSKSRSKSRSRSCSKSRSRSRSKSRSKSLSKDQTATFNRLLAKLPKLPKLDS